MTTKKLDKGKMLLSEFDIVYVIRKAMKAHTLADNLAENHVDEEVSFVGEDISEEYQGWRLFFDG